MPRGSSFQPKQQYHVLFQSKPPCSLFTSSSAATESAPLWCRGPLVTHVSTLHKSSNPILNFLFSLFHALQLSFAHSQFWSQRMLTDQMNSVSLRTRLFLSPWAGITLFSELNTLVLSGSQRREGDGAPWSAGRGSGFH